MWADVGIATYSVCTSFEIASTNEYRRVLELQLLVCLQIGAGRIAVTTGIPQGWYTITSYHHHQFHKTRIYIWFWLRIFHLTINKILLLRSPWIDWMLQNIKYQFCQYFSSSFLLLGMSWEAVWLPFLGHIGSCVPAFHRAYHQAHIDDVQYAGDHNKSHNTERAHNTQWPQCLETTNRSRDHLQHIPKFQ